MILYVINIFRNFLQETYEILDTLFYDIGTTGTINPKWYQSFTNGETVSFVSSSTGLKFTNTTSTGYVVAPNISGNPSPTIAEMVLFEDGTVCEFEMVDKTATTILQTRDINGALNQIDLTDIVNPNITLTYKDGYVKVKANNTEIFSNAQTGKVMIRIQTINGYFEFKNFKVYPV